MSNQVTQSTASTAVTSTDTKLTAPTGIKLDIHPMHRSMKGYAVTFGELITMSFLNGVTVVTGAFGIEALWFLWGIEAVEPPTNPDVIQRAKLTMYVFFVIAALSQVIHWVNVWRVYRESGGHGLISWLKSFRH